VFNVRENASSTIRKDGIREQIDLLGELSKTLDEYFALRCAGSDWRYSR
jgi:hypothetical protein